jgi:thiol-disulfide isomerase/thioredoxin
MRTALGAVAVLLLAAAAMGAYQALTHSRGEPALRIPRMTMLSAPRTLPPLDIRDAAGHPVSLDRFRGKVVLLNLWATWCAPCRKEMPALDRLEAKLGGPDFAVLAISIERGGVAKVRAFYGETGVKALRVYIDEQGEASAAIRSPAIPTSVLVAGDGREIGRLYGAAEWDGPAAVGFIRERIDESKGR